MFNLLKHLLFICYWLILLPVKADHQPVTYDMAKAHYIVEVIKHITKTETEKSSITIGVLGKSPALYQALENYSDHIKIRGKSFTIHSIETTDVNNQFTAIVVTSKKLHLISKLNEQNLDTLIISDGRVSKSQQMISLISNAKHNDIELTLNRENIIARGYSISNSMLGFAGSKEDLSSQLKEQTAHMREQEKQIKQQQDNLSALILDVEKREILLNELNQKLNSQNIALESTQNDLNNKSQQLSLSQTQLKNIQLEKQSVQQEILKIRADLHKQQALIKKKQQEVELQELESQRLYAQIQSNKDILDKQHTIIDKKEQTISHQRILLYVAISVTVVILLLFIFLLHINKLRKKANVELRELNEQLYQLATTDSMTNLFNRRHFLESSNLQIIQMHRTKDPCAILMMDIDNFKSINDTYGHAIGDKAIIDVANVFLKNLRKYDIVGRLGGEEFAMILTNCHMEKAEYIAERIREKVAQLACKVDGSPIILTISVGLTMLQDDDKSIECVLQRADKALYKAKDKGRNVVVKI